MEANGLVIAVLWIISGLVGYMCDPDVFLTKEHKPISYMRNRGQELTVAMFLGPICFFIVVKKLIEK